MSNKRVLDKAIRACDDGLEGEHHTVNVGGKDYDVWSDFMKRQTLAKNSEGVTKVLRSSGYVSNESTIKKLIKIMFN